MAFDIEQIRKNYDALASGVSNSWEVYTGEQAEELATQTYNIPKEKWMEDCVAMQVGQETVREELDQGVPKTDEERLDRARALIARQVRGYLCSQKDDAGRRGMLLHALQSASNFQLSDERVAELSRMDINALQNEVVNAAMHLLHTVALPKIKQACEMAQEQVQANAQELGQPDQAMDNPGALAVAAYLAAPALQQMPFLAGAGACAACAGGTDVEDTFAFTLLIIGAALVCVSLMVVVSNVIAAAGMFVAGCLMGETVGFFALVAENLAVASGFITVPALLGAGALLIAGLSSLITKLVNNFGPGNNTWRIST